MLTKKRLAFLAVSLFIGFLLISRGVSTNAQWIYQLDAYGNELFRLDVTREMTDRIFFLTQIGSIRNLLYLALVIGAILILKKERKHFFWFGTTMAISGGLAPLLIKTSMQRARPTDGLFLRTGYSFPSGHTMGTLALYGLVILLCFMYIEKRWLRNTLVGLSLAIIILVSWSRIHLGVHFLTDIIGSVFLGVSLLIGSWLALDFFNNSKNQY